MLTWQIQKISKNSNTPKIAHNTLIIAIILNKILKSMLKRIKDVFNVVKYSKVVINTLLIVPTQLLRNSRQTIC